MHRRRSFALLAAAFSLFPAISAAAKPPATAAELERAAAEVRDGGGAAGPLSRALAGRRFQFTIVPRQRGPKNEICTGYPSWGWYAREGRFEVNASEDSHLSDFFVDAAGRRAAPIGRGELLYMVSFACRYSREPERQVLNMYGETVTHEPSREEVIAIATARPAPDRMELGGWGVSIDEAGGRRLGARMVVRISGTIGRWRSGRTIVCGTDDHSSLGAPVLTTEFSGCLVNGQVDRVEYVDSATGQVRRTVRVKGAGRLAR